MFDKATLELENEKMQKILQETTDKLEIYKVYGEFWDKYLKDRIVRGDNGVIYFQQSDLKDRDVDRFLESDALCTFCKYAVRKRRDFPYVFEALFGYSVNPLRDETNARRVIDVMRDYILSEKEDGELKYKLSAKDLDEKIACYVTATRFRNIKIDDETWTAIKNFYDNLPEDYNFFDTKFCERFWLTHKDHEKEIYDVHPIKSKEELETELSKFTIDRRGMVNDPIKYDRTLGEYLRFYGDEISYEDKERYLQIMSRNAYNGKFYETQTSKYFKDTVDGMRILDNNPLVVFNDILRNYKDSCYNVTCMNSDIYRRIFVQMKMYYKDYISNLARYGEDAIDFVNYLMSSKGAHYFTRRYNVLDDFSNSQDVVNVEMFLRGTDVVEPLTRNFDDDKLYDETVHEDGLTNFDYADKAFGLIARYVKTGIQELNDDETRELYERHGRDVRDSRAFRQVVDHYITSKYKNYEDKEIKDKCVELVTYVSRKPGFDLYSNRECSDFVRLAKCTNDDFAKYLENEILKAMMESPEYSNLSLDEAKGYAYDFMNNVGDRPIGQEMEENFNGFLRAISVMKINDKRGIVPREINEFLIRQSLTENSILNSTEERYESILERAYENLRANEGRTMVFVRDRSHYKSYEYNLPDFNIVESKTLIREILNNPEYDFVHKKETTPTYVSQYVDLDAIEADILGKLEAARAENSEFAIVKAEGTDYEDR